MQIIPLLSKEFEEETAITRKMLHRVPDDRYDWKPHEKSMSIRQLAGHLAEIPAWVTMAFKTSELDFAKGDYKPTIVNNTQELLEAFEKSVAAGKASFEKATEEELWPNWTIRSGDHIIAVYTKYETIRHAFAQTIHHRAQLGVFLRLLNVAIPGSYGPSADEMGFL